MQGIFVRLFKPSNGSQYFSKECFGFYNGPASVDYESLLYICITTFRRKARGSLWGSISCINVNFSWKAVLSFLGQRVNVNFSNFMFPTGLRTQ